MFLIYFIFVLVLRDVSTQKRTIDFNATTSKDDYLSTLTPQTFVTSIQTKPSSNVTNQLLDGNLTISSLTAVISTKSSDSSFRSFENITTQNQGSTLSSLSVQSSTLKNTLFFPTLRKTSSTITSLVNVNLTTPSSGTSGILNSNQSTSQNVSDVSYETTPSNKISTTNYLPSSFSSTMLMTKPSVNIPTTIRTSSISSPSQLYNIVLVIKFSNDNWIRGYRYTSSFAFLIKSKDIASQIKKALHLFPVFSVTVFSLTQGSLIANTSIQFFRPVPIIDVSNAITRNIPGTSIKNPPPWTLPDWAVIIIAVTCTIVVIALAFMITVIICRRRRLRGYGRHIEESVEMDGWKYNAQISSYEDNPNI